MQSMDLAEIIKEIKRRKQWTQRAMAAELGVQQQTIQRAENAGRNLKKQFDLFLRLLPLLEEFGYLDKARELNSHELAREFTDYALQERSGRYRQTEEAKRKSAPGGDKTSAHFIPPRRHGKRQK